MIRQEEVFRIGRIGRPHGIKGEVIFMFSDDVFDQVDADYLILQVDGILVPFFIEEYRFRTDESVLLKLEGIDTQEQARELTHCEVFFPRALALDQEEGVSWAQIVGFQIVNAAGLMPIGTIASVDDSTENVLLEVTSDTGKELLIPAASALIQDIDEAHQVIIMDLPEGLLSL
jgi:16S rRNA processing protein RimM